MRPKVVLIAAIAPGRLIGGDNRMPWHMPRDLRFFRRVTQNHVVIMGRKTFESLGRKPLPRRTNVVVSRNHDFQAAGSTVAHSLEDAIAIFPDQRVVFVIGGGQLYSQAVAIADEILLTEIVNHNPNMNLFEAFRGDTFFPEISPDRWHLIKRGRLYKAANKVTIPRELDHGGLYMRFTRFRNTRPTTETTQ